MIIFGSYANFKSVYQSGNSGGGGFQGYICYVQDGNGNLVRAGLGFHGDFAGGDTIWVFTDSVAASNIINDFSKVVQVSDVRYDVNVL